MRTATELNYGEKAKIENVDFNHPSCRRILEYGFTPGQEIEMINKSIFNDPIAFSVRGAIIAIRKNEADCIVIS